MTLTGLLILTLPANTLSSQFRNLLSAASKHVSKTLYIQLDPGRKKLLSPASIASDSQLVCARLITSLYASAYHLCRSLDVRIFLDNVKLNSNEQQRRKTNETFEVVLTDCVHPTTDVKNFLNHRFHQNTDAIPIVSLLSDDVTINSDPESWNTNVQNGRWKDYNNVVLGGTFDRLHNGHKILLSEALLRCRKKLTVGVTDDKIVKHKLLSELIEGTELRIELLQNFLHDADPTVEYFVTPILDPFGPATEDPSLECIIVSEETKRGGLKVNEERRRKGLSNLDICCISLVDDENHSVQEEAKISSSSTRIRLLGTRLKRLEPKPKNGLKPYVIGLTGSIGSGKSAICKRMEGLGAVAINADLLAHQTYRQGTSTFQKIKAEFGTGVVGEDGEIDRKVLGKIVFSDKNKLAQLNTIVWPDLKALISSHLQEHQSLGTAVVVIEAAVLLEAGMDDLVDEVWVTVIPEDEAVKRIQERNNLTAEQAQQRISSQSPSRDRVAYATVVLSTLWEPSFTQKQVEIAWRGLQDFLEKVHVAKL